MPDMFLCLSQQGSPCCSDVSILILEADAGLLMKTPYLTKYENQRIVNREFTNSFKDRYSNSKRAKLWIG